MARPSKIDKFIEAAKKVVYNPDMVYLTDEELVFVINKELDEKDRIHKSTFEKWKAGNFDEKGETGKEFLRVIKDALIQQKINLFNRFGKKDDMWTKWAWIIERKFSEWNLKIITENKNENNNTHSGEIKINMIVPNGDKSKSK